MAAILALSPLAPGCNGAGDGEADSGQDGGVVAASIAITLSDETPAVEQVVTVAATILDVEGSPVEAPWTLSVAAEPGSDAQRAIVDGHTVTFSDEGRFTAVGTIDGTSLSDSFGPFPVDSMPPSIVVTSPARGTFTESAAVTVSGTVTDTVSSIATATVNGEAVPLGSDGSFSWPMTCEPGISLIETLAADVTGSRAADRRAVLIGSFLGLDEDVGEGIVVRVNPGALGAIEGLACDRIDAYDDPDLFPSLLYSDLVETCTFDICVDLYALDLWATGSRHGSVETELDPLDDGSVHTTVVVSDVEVDWAAEGVVTEVDYSASGTGSAASVQVAATLTPSVSEGVLQVAMSDVAVSTDGFVVEWPPWIEDAAAFFECDATSLLQGFLEESIEAAVTATLPSALEGFLQDLAIGTSLSVGGAEYDLAASPSVVVVDDSGMTLVLATAVDPSEWRSPWTGPGSLYAGYVGPAYADAPGLVLSFSADFLDQALFAFWGGGILSHTFAAEQVDIEAADLALLLDEPADLRAVAVDALLPPVVLPGTGGHVADLRLGDVEVLLCRDDPCDPSAPLARLFVGLEAGLDVHVTESATLGATLDDTQAWLDVVEPLRATGLEVDAESLLAALVPLLSDRIVGAIQAIPIPSVDGLSLTDVTVGAAGAEGGYIDVAGELSEP